MPCASASGSTGSANNSPPHSSTSSLRFTVHSSVLFRVLHAFVEARILASFS